MRHLIYALEGCGNYIDSERSLDAYLQIVENEKKTLARMRNSNAKPPGGEDVVQDDVDSDEDILRTMADGVRILVKFLNKGRKALDIAVKMEGFAKAWNIDNENILGNVWHSVGLANSLWSMQSIFPSNL